VAAILGFLISRAYKFEGRRIWLIVALVALSHFLLDGLVHVAGLPLLGDDSPKLGLGLWNHLRLELSLETLMAAAGMVVYWNAAGSRSSALPRCGMAVFVALVTAMTWTQLRVSVPPKPTQLTVAWIIVPLLFSAVAYALDRKRVQGATAAR